MYRNLIIFFPFCIFLFSCSTQPEQSRSSFIDFDDSGMLANKEYLFQPFDSISPSIANNLYDLYLELRYSNVCRIKQLPIDIEIGSVWDDSIINKKINLKLFDKDDNFQGKGNFGVYEISANIIDSIKIKDGFFISVSTPESNTKGIISLGTLIKKI